VTRINPSTIEAMTRRRIDIEERCVKSGGKSQFTAGH
jgi:hypothetical protein